MYSFILFLVFINILTQANVYLYPQIHKDLYLLFFSKKTVTLNSISWNKKENLSHVQDMWRQGCLTESSMMSRKFQVLSMCYILWMLVFSSVQFLGGCLSPSIKFQQVSFKRKKKKAIFQESPFTSQWTELDHKTSFNPVTGQKSQDYRDSLE